MLKQYELQVQLAELFSCSFVVLTFRQRVRLRAHIDECEYQLLLPVTLTSYGTTNN